MQALASLGSLAMTLAVRLIGVAVLVFFAVAWGGRALAQMPAVKLVIIRVQLLLVVGAVKSVIAAQLLRALDQAALDLMEMHVCSRQHRQQQLLQQHQRRQTRQRRLQRRHFRLQLR